jgi:hydroxymethylglutaryl-CoA reductase
MTESSEIPGFYKLPMKERIEMVKNRAGLTDEESEAIADTGGLPPEVADRMIENVIGGITIPMGIATNFRINGKDYLVPMAL